MGEKTTLWGHALELYAVRILEVEFDLFDCVFVKRRHRCFRDIKTGFGEVVHVLLCRLN